MIVKIKDTNNGKRKYSRYTGGIRHAGKRSLLGGKFVRPYNYGFGHFDKGSSTIRRNTA